MKKSYFFFFLAAFFLAGAFFFTLIDSLNAVASLKVIASFEGISMRFLVFRSVPERALRRFTLKVPKSLMRQT